MSWEATWVTLHNGLAQFPAHGKYVVEVRDDDRGCDDGDDGDDDYGDGDDGDGDDSDGDGGDGENNTDGDDDNNDGDVSNMVRIMMMILLMYTEHLIPADTMQV